MVWAALTRKLAQGCGKELYRTSICGMSPAIQALMPRLSSTSARGAARTAAILHKLVPQGLHRPPPQPPGPLDLILPVDLLAMRNSTGAPHSAGIWETQLSAG